MELGKRAKKFVTWLALLFAVLVAFTVLYGVLDTAFAPYTNIDDEVVEPGYAYALGEIDDSYGIGHDGHDARADPAVPGAAALPVAPGDPRRNGEFVLLKMYPSDVFSGSLILINNAYSYDIPEMNDLVAVMDAKTESYRAADENVSVSEMMIGPLNDMMDAFHAETGNRNVSVVSAFRDYARQQEVLDTYTRRMGRANALQWVALPGHSEHHAGLAVDFGVYSNGVNRTFQGTGVYSWFRENSYLFGFVLRFDKLKSDVTGVTEEQWHFRYAGNPHAGIMYEYDLCLEEYIGLVMGHSFGEPFAAVYDGVGYEIYYVRGTTVAVPFDCDFDISGNNIDGFIVTTWR